MTRYRTISIDHRANNFDALRLILAAMVVVHHLGILSQEASIGWMTHISASFAVEAFFVVSGYLVTMSFENSTSIQSYAIKRLRRIYPAYFVVVVLAAVTLSMFSTLSMGDYFRSREFWRYLGFNLIFSNFAAPSLPGVFVSNFTPAVNGSLWTIKIEIVFYCLVPILVWAVRKVGYRIPLLLLIGASLAWRWGFTALAATSHSKFYGDLSRQLPGQMAFFAGGAWTYYRSRTGGGMPFLLAVLGLVAYVSIDAQVGQFFQPLDVTAIVYWVALECPKLPSLARHGDFSYGTYLCHFPVIQLAIWLGMFHLSTTLAVVAVIAAVAVCTACSWHFVEKPMLLFRAKAAASS